MGRCSTSRDTLSGGFGFPAGQLTRTHKSDSRHLMYWTLDARSSSCRRWERRAQEGGSNLIVMANACYSSVRAHTNAHFDMKRPRRLSGGGMGADLNKKKRRRRMTPVARLNLDVRGWRKNTRLFSLSLSLPRAKHTRGGGDYYKRRRPTFSPILAARVTTYYGIGMRCHRSRTQSFLLYPIVYIHPPTTVPTFIDIRRAAYNPFDCDAIRALVSQILYFINRPAHAQRT